MFTNADDCMKPPTSVTSARPRASDPSTLLQRYRIADIVDFIVASPETGGSCSVCRYKAVALQFPDELLPDSVRVVQALTNAVTQRTGDSVIPKLFVLADTTFSSCCPDEITAQHYHADAIVHFGYACLSRTLRLPVFYVHETSDVTADDVVTRLAVMVRQNRQACGSERQEASVQTVVLLSANTLSIEGDVVAAILSNATLREDLAASNGSIVVTSPHATREFRAECGATSCVEVARSVQLTSSTMDGQWWWINSVPVPNVCSTGGSNNANTVQRILFVGSPDAPQAAQVHLIGQYYSIRHTEACRQLAESISNLPAESDDCPVDGSTVVFTSPSRLTSSTPANLVHQRIRQRMFNIETIKSSSAVGIIVASLSIEGYRETAEMLKKIIRRSAGGGTARRAYIIYIGHLNEFKVANFVDSIDCFVAIACPNARECHFPGKRDGYLKPVVTPCELLIALGVIPFDHPNAFTTNFSVLLQIGDAYISSLSATAAQASGAISGAISGTITPDCEDASSRALVATRTSTALTVGPASTGALQRLHERAYVGLEPKIGQTPVQAHVAEGKSGIARGYETERAVQDRQ